MNCFVFSKILLRYLRFLFYLEFSILFQYLIHFGQIQYFFKVLKTNFEIQYFQYNMGTLYNLCSLSVS